MTIHIVRRRWLERRKKNDNKYILCPLSCHFTTNKDCQEQHITRHTNNRFIYIYIYYIYVLYRYIYIYIYLFYHLVIQEFFYIWNRISQSILMILKEC